MYTYILEMIREQTIDNKTRRTDETDGDNKMLYVGTSLNSCHDFFSLFVL